MLTDIEVNVGYTINGDHMSKKQQQLKIASILYDLGLDDQLICIMTSLNQEEINRIKNN